MLINITFNHKVYMIKIIMSMFAIILLICSTVYGIGGSDSSSIPTYFQGYYPFTQQSLYTFDLYGFTDPIFQKGIYYKIPDLYKIPDPTAPIIQGAYRDPAIGWTKYTGIFNPPYALYYNPLAEANPQPVLDGSYLSNWLYGSSYYYNPVAEADPQPSARPIFIPYFSNWVYGGFGVDPIPTPRPIGFSEIYFGSRPYNVVGVDPIPTP